MELRVFKLLPFLSEENMDERMKTYLAALTEEDLQWLENIDLHFVSFSEKMKQENVSQEALENAQRIFNWCQFEMADIIKKMSADEKDDLKMRLEEVLRLLSIEF